MAKDNVCRINFTIKNIEEILIELSNIDKKKENHFVLRTRRNPIKGMKQFDEAMKKQAKIITDKL